MLLYNLFYFDARTGRMTDMCDFDAIFPKQAPEGTIIRAECKNGEPETLWLDQEGNFSEQVPAVVQAARDGSK